MKETLVSDSDGGVLLRNLRCLMSPPSSSEVSPPPCPPPSSTCSSAASSPRPSESPEPKNNNGTESDSGHSSTSECPSVTKCEQEDHKGCPTCPGLFGVIDKIANVLEAKCPVSEGENDFGRLTSENGCTERKNEIVVTSELSTKCPTSDNSDVDRFGSRSVTFSSQNEKNACPAPIIEILVTDSESDGSSDSGGHLPYIDEADEEEEECSSLVEIIAEAEQSSDDNRVSDSALLVSSSSDDDESSSISSVIRAPLAAAEADDSGCEEAAHKEAVARSIIERQSASRAHQRDTADAGAAAMRQKDTADGGPGGGGGGNNNAPACTEACVASECCWNDECLEKRRRPALKSIIKGAAGHQQPPHKRRVTFNENCNKFFDADYVILVGEDANGDETTRLVSMCKKQPNNPHQPDSFPAELCPFDQNVDYVDHQVTLSPPEGYKDVLGAVRQDDESESESSGEAQDEDGCQSPICEQCSACSACASQHQQQQRYIVETITLTTVTERRIVREADGNQEQPQLSGILKGGKLWKNCSDSSSVETASSPASDEGESSALVRRSVRFSEEDEEGGDKDFHEKEQRDNRAVIIEEARQEDPPTPPSELNLTLRLGSVLLKSDNLPPNSAVRQLFPDSKAQKRLLSISDDSAGYDGRELKSPGISGGGSNSDDELSRGSSSSIRRTIERNALRRSLLRYSDPMGTTSRRRSVPNRDDNSLVERIKMLTCDIDDEPRRSESPHNQMRQIVGRERCHSESGKDFQQPLQVMQDNSCCWLMVDPPRGSIKITASRKQFALGERETPPDGSANSAMNTAMAPDGTIYSLDDIDEVLANECVCPPDQQSQQQPPPDILATVQQQQDELAMFVQRDYGRIERLKKRYSLTEDDDQDDYGFSRRPSVRGIKPCFGSTTEIIQRIQLQLQPPPLANPNRAGSHITWPYPPESTSSSTSSPVLSPTEGHPPRRRTQPPIPIRSNNSHMPMMQEDPYYATVPSAHDYRYVEYANGGAYANGAAYVYASSYPARTDSLPYSESPPTRYLPSTGTLPPPQRRAPVVYPPYAAAPQQQQQQQQGGGRPRPVYRSDSPQRGYYYAAPLPSQQQQQQQTRYYAPAPYAQQGKYPAVLPPPPQQNDLPSPSAAMVRALSPVPADSPTRSVLKFERGAPEGASASPGFPQQDYYTATRAGVVPADADQPPPTSQQQQQHQQQQNSSVYYAMNV